MWKRLFSYILPVFEKSVMSEVSGKMTLSWINGRLLLDSPNANYSFGSLQRILKTGLKNSDEKKIREAKNILLLGLGGGSVIQTLRNDFHNKGKITAVEIDALMIELSSVYFKISDYEPIVIVNEDAFDFVKSKISIPESEKFDLLIVDIFIDNEIPEKFSSVNFIENLAQLFKKNGTGIFNTICISEKHLKRNEKIRQSLSRYFELREIKSVEKTNDLFLLKKI